jgi:hypothetical protein
MPAGLKSSSGNRFEEALFPTAQIQRGELVLMNPDISAGVVAATTHTLGHNATQKGLPGDLWKSGGSSRDVKASPSVRNVRKCS